MNNTGHLKQFRKIAAATPGTGFTPISGERLKIVVAELDRLRAENERLQTRSAIVDAINALREEEGQAVNIPNANPDWGGPAQVITVYADFTDDVGKGFTSDPGIHGMDESLLNCLLKARAAAQAAKAQFQNQGGKP